MQRRLFAVFWGVIFVFWSGLAVAQFELETRPVIDTSKDLTLDGMFASEATPISGPLKDFSSAPPDSILDDARIFDDAGRADMVSVLRAAKKEHGYEFYIAAFTYVAGETVEERAVRLRDAWVRTPRGIVIVYERGSQKMTMCSHEAYYDFLAKPELAEVFEAAYTAAAIYEDPAKRLYHATDALVFHLAETLRPLEQDRQLFNEGMLKLLGAFFITIALLGLIGFGMFRLQRWSDRRRSIQFRFPEVVVGKRLGAAFGGGVMAEMSFDETPAKPDAQPRREEKTLDAPSVPETESPAIV